ncbi:similar to Saccharomyces cerevisiae YDR276C PMP3 Small plasma membrane protein related to a family of plant polypeptides that are overexpressed under high salt concentration or low temperature [Maudiozyma barnettii]|uniref:Plasma membrane proteolipid Pmp3 n=2 Tax=Maudiozyma TaxID=3162980 RepID=A0A9P6WG81_MAUEX|nr:Pmp3p [Kazachstania barnettii]KAG0671855.1 plasma membrane proteolipid Pmp3 [Kazachstania exigua]CAB4256287.1 similar to Saccharomyces cerevisiae YDR276C PMP3 Small plasma membrane protein related to a family of plant polypeptides that are overexpressed under high salt concentration or low temperature [Kazachstania barnettii]CAD1784896.1 similar to Saccharomyces cerevisiae YDR276C PMP3 Small plasma membrane protein related to a family of plant polypeptides that are overexpressed under high sa
MEASKIINIILALFLPPVSVFLARGWGTECIVSIVLTICGWVPGMLYALYIILQDD